MPRITVHDLPEKILNDSSELFICLAQTPPPTKDQIQAGVAADGLLPFLRSLLLSQNGQNSRINDMAPARDAWTLILLPEFALSMAHWEEVDAMIRQLDRSVIFIGGIGVVDSAALSRWKKEQTEGATTREFAFPDDLVSGVVRYNAGCCWIHRPAAGTTSIVFLKNYLERTSEAVKIDGLGEGTHLLCIRATDACIYPLICAEFTSGQERGKPLERIKRHIESENTAAGRKILITGSLFEPLSSHPLWHKALTESVSLHQEVNTIIVNNALDPCKTEVIMVPKRIAMKSFADFAAGTQARKRATLRRYKYPDDEGLAMATYYYPAKSAIIEFIRDNSDLQWLLDKAHELEDRSLTPNKSLRTKVLNNARAIRSYSMYFGHSRFRLLKGAKLPFHLNGATR